MLDAELLAEVYVELIGARQTSLSLAAESIRVGDARISTVVRIRPQPLTSRLVAAELDAHRAFVATLGEAAIWRKYLTDSAA